MSGIDVKRGDIWLAELEHSKGDVIRGKRPVVVISNDIINCHSKIVTVIPITSAAKRLGFCHVEIVGYGLHKASTALTEQIVTISKENFLLKIGTIIGTKEMQKIERAVKLQMDVA
jgi:mRNA interferase MazF